MKTVSLVFLAAFTVWAASVVSRDLATRKIPNAAIKTGMRLFAASLAAFLVYTALGYTGRAQSFMNYNFYLLLAIHLFWSVLAGLVLWYSEIWPAGDAKFFMLVSASLPLANPYLRNFPHYLFLSLLINIFVSAAVWILGSFIASGFSSASPSDFFAEVWSDMKKRMAVLSAGRNKAAVAALALNIGFVFLLHQVLALEARGFLGKIFSRADILFFFMFMLWDKIGGAFSSRRWGYLSAGCYAVYFVGGFFFFPEHLWLLASGALSNFFKFSLLLFFGRFMLEFLMEKKDMYHVTARELEPGMVLSAKASKMLKDNTAFEGAFDDCFKDGLSEEQVGELRTWLNSLKVHNPKVEVVRGRPFALWIFAGAVLSLVLDRNLAGMLR
ncbi:MAG: hypothetical protein AUJ51_07165 [Elusimicrobia bacterium CG1_02_56_21]|nr:MAG: hypothetical protein AUJ51_07165 [Elusimicrobia bacterium CG1_02_56_21]